MEKLNLIKDIQRIQFVALELALYLNTHPTDERALNMRNRTIRKLMALQDEYIEKYGPLTLNCARFSYPWDWIDEPWPWQIRY